MRRTESALRRSQKDPRAFVEVYDQHAAGLERFFRGRTRDPQTALDLTAETLAKIYESREKFRGHSMVEEAAWVWATARNELAMYWRRRGVERSALGRLGIQQVPAVSLGPEALDRGEGDFGDLELLLSELPDAQQEVLRLRYGQELEDAQIARRLGVSAGVVRARASRGLRRLLSVLDEGSA